jgi:transposase
MTKRKNRVYTDEFRQEAVALVTEQGYTVIEAAASLGITSKLIYNWKSKLEMEKSGQSLNVDERTELALLRKENKQLRLEKDILKRPAPSLQGK